MEKLIITGTNLEEAKEAIDVIKQHNESKYPWRHAKGKWMHVTESSIGEGQMLYSTVGCHPTRCDEFEQSSGGPTEYLNHLLKLAQENPSTVVAIGECGLGNMSP